VDNVFFSEPENFHDDSQTIVTDETYTRLIEEYFQAISAGKPERVASFLENPPEENTWMDQSIYETATNLCPITDIAIGEIVQQYSSSNEAEFMADVSYKFAGKGTKISLLLIKNSTTVKIANGFNKLPYSHIKMISELNLDLLINDVVTSTDSNDLYTLPGCYYYQPNSAILTFKINSNFEEHHSNLVDVEFPDGSAVKVITGPEPPPDDYSTNYGDADHSDKDSITLSDTAEIKIKGIINSDMSDCVATAVFQTPCGINWNGEFSDFDGTIKTVSESDYRYNIKLNYNLVVEKEGIFISTSDERNFFRVYVDLQSSQNDDCSLQIGTIKPIIDYSNPEIISVTYEWEPSGSATTPITCKT
jgi:hypothetical protein